MKKQQDKLFRKLYYVQEIEPKYVKAFIDYYFSTHDLHERLEIIRELSKYKSDRIIKFFYKVNACTRNFSLKEESMRYIQGLGLPFVLRRKKKGKTTYIDDEIVVNESSPEILRKRLYVDRLERLKVFDVFISHNSKDESDIVSFFKFLNEKGGSTINSTSSGNGVMHQQPKSLKSALSRAVFLFCTFQQKLWNLNGVHGNWVMRMHLVKKSVSIRAVKAQHTSRNFTPHILHWYLTHRL